MHPLTTCPTHHSVLPLPPHLQALAARATRPAGLGAGMVTVSAQKGADSTHELYGTATGAAQQALGAAAGAGQEAAGAARAGTGEEDGRLSGKVRAELEECKPLYRARLGLGWALQTVRSAQLPQLLVHRKRTPAPAHPILTHLSPSCRAHGGRGCQPGNRCTAAGRRPDPCGPGER